MRYGQELCIRPAILLWNDIDTKRACRTDDGATDALERQTPHMFILPLDLGNLIDVLEADRRESLLPCPRSPFRDASNLFEEVGCCRGFGSKCEGSIGLDNDSARDRNAGVDVCRTSVKLFAEIHGLDAFGTKRRPDRRCWCCFACADHKPLQSTI